MVTRTNENFFKYYKNSLPIMLVDKTIAKSGNCLKNFYFRQPDHWDALAAKAKERTVEIGNAVKTSWGIIVVARKHYASKWDITTVEQIWKALLPKFCDAGKELHIDIEDYPWFAEIIERNDLPQANIIIHNHSEWEWGYDD